MGNNLIRLSLNSAKLTDLIISIKLTSKNKSEIINAVFEITLFIISVLCIIPYYVFLKGSFEIGQISSAYGSTLVIIEIYRLIIVISYMQKAYDARSVGTYKPVFGKQFFNLLHIPAAFEVIVGGSYYSVFVF